MSLPHEQTVNVHFAEILNEYLHDSFYIVAENKKKNKRFDIKIDFKNVEFILEASYNIIDAENDAKGRLSQGLINTVAIAVHYEPNSFKGRHTAEEIKNTLKNTPIKLRVYTLGKDISNTLLEFIEKSKNPILEESGGWLYTNYSDMGSFFEFVIELIVKENIIEKFIASIEENVNEFVTIAKVELEASPNKEEIIQKLNNLLFSPSLNEGEDLELPNVPIEILLSHTYISELMAATLYQSVFFKYSHLSSLKGLLQKYHNNSLLAMQDGFCRILEINYDNVFTVANKSIDILNEFGSQTKINRSFADLINQINEIISNQALLRQDFIGQIYHKITGDISVRKGYATYYTKSPIATFMTTLCLDYGFWKIRKHQKFFNC
jgi:hypothetical protein